MVWIPGSHEIHQLFTCVKCGHELQDDWIVCPYCGQSLVKKVKTQEKKTGIKTRANGTGTAYKRGKTWTVKVVVGWNDVEQDDDSIGKKAIYRTKGGFKTKTEALAYVPKLLSSPHKPKSNESFRQIYERWAELYAPRISTSCMATYKAAFKYFQEIEHRKITDIVYDELQTCINACPKKRSTKDNMRSVASLVFRYAMQNNLIDRNPAEGLHCGTEKKGTHAPFTPAELKIIEENVGKLPYADYVYVLCYTGFRPGELLAMKKATAYDKEHNCLIGGSKTKAGRNRVMPIHQGLSKIIDAQMSQPGEYIFPDSNGNRMSDEHFRTCCFEPLMKKLGIEGKVPYSCRHTFSNLIKNVRGSNTDKAALMGHSDTSMTEYYQSADYESLRSIINEI